MQDQNLQPVAPLTEIIEHESRLLERMFSAAVDRHLINADGIDFNISESALRNGDVLLSEPGLAGNLFVVVGRVSAKGSPALMGIMPLLSSLKGLVGRGLSAGEIASALNQCVTNVYPEDMVMEMAILEFDADRRNLKCWSGGMPDLVVLGQDGRLKQRIPAAHEALAVLEDFEFSEDTTALELSSGDKIFQCTHSFYSVNGCNDQGLQESTVDELIDAANSDLFSELSRALNIGVQGELVSDQVAFVQVAAGFTPANEQDLHSSVRPLCIPWHFRVRLEAEELKKVNPTAQITQFLRNSHNLSVHQDYVSTLLGELYSNALEHGVLGLDSKLKETDDGFLEYYSQRSSRLEALTDGWVDISISFKDPEVTIRVHDSGKGFDFENLSGRKESDDASFGRGTSILESLCKSISYSHGGSCIEVIYAT